MIATQVQLERLKRIHAVSAVMDSRFSFFGVEYGLDSIIGLVPWLGDVVTGCISLYIVWESIQIGVPKEIIRKMIRNIIVDVFIGGIPVVGDIFDLLFKANKRNVAMVNEYLGLEQSA